MRCRFNNPCRGAAPHWRRRSCWSGPGWSQSTIARLLPVNSGRVPNSYQPQWKTMYTSWIYPLQEQAMYEREIRWPSSRLSRGRKSVDYTRCWGPATLGSGRTRWSDIHTSGYVHIWIYNKMVRYTYIWLCTYLNLQQDDLNQDFEIDSKSRILDFASMVREETTCQLKLQNIDSPYHLSFYVLRDDQAPELDLGNQDSTSRRYRALVLLISSYLSSIRGHTESQ